MKTKILLFTAILLTTFRSFATPPLEEGKTIFSARCASCHNVNKVLTGTALGGVDQRRPIEWIVKFVQSSQSVVKSGDQYAVALFDKFNKIPMPDHQDLTADNIKSIVEYIKSESSTTGSEKAPFAKPLKLRPNYLPLSISNYGFFIGYLSVVGLLILALLLAVQLKQYERKVHGQE